MNSGGRKPSTAKLPGGATAALSVHIDRLVVDGISLRPGQGAQLQHAIETELAGLLRDRPAGAFGGGGAVPEVQAPSITMKTAWRPASLERAE
jgi:hypothetical protein